MHLLDRWKQRKNFQREMIVSLSIIGLIVLLSIAIVHINEASRIRGLCLRNINYLKTGQYVYSFNGPDKYFKTQEEAIEYCYLVLKSRRY